MSSLIMMMRERLKTLASSKKRGITLLEMLLFLWIASSIIVGFLLLAHKSYQNNLAEELSSKTSRYDVDNSKPAEQVVETFFYPVEKAVRVDATGTKGPRSVVCAVNKDGSLEFFKTGELSGSLTFGKIDMNADLGESVQSFCDRAFARLATDS